MYIHSTAGEASRVNAASLWLISVAKAYLQGFLGHEKSLQDILHTGTLDKTAQQSYGLHLLQTNPRNFNTSVETNKKNTVQLVKK